jgi:hypothetical protein
MNHQQPQLSRFDRGGVFPSISRDGNMRGFQFKAGESSIAVKDAPPFPPSTWAMSRSSRV